MYAELERKICTRCKEQKSISSFYIVAGTKRARPECRKCTNAYSRKYRSTDSGKAAMRRARDKYHKSPDNIEKNAQNKQEWARFKKYGITKSDFLKMLEQQNYRCIIDGTHHNDEPRGLVVDHCHKTGVVRGLLCHRCNAGIGYLRENKSSFENAIAYLEKFKK